MNTNNRNILLPEIKNLEQAFKTVSEYLNPSPLIPLPKLGNNIWLKLETLRPSGSFKIRGAIYALSSIPKEKNIVTCSAGNHGLAVAEMAKTLGRSVTIVVSENASPKKIELLKQKADKLIVYGASYDDAEEYSRKLAEESGAIYLSPYNDPDVILGQATIGMEILQKISGPITVVCSVGGGGLAAGIAMAFSERTGCKTIGVEALNSAPMRIAIANGKTTYIDIQDTIADGLAGNLEPGSITVELLSKYNTEMETASEEEIYNAMRYLASNYGLVAEGAGATAFAAILSGKISLTNENPVVIVVSGRNIQMEKWHRIISS
ncbi:threonine ammonia-lyase [Leptospira santarosai]|uniref:threonine ammonia-lyase n=1 Tax=Leptospira santarosai TaxID=28183 RepID=UPI000248953F|nr:pyridoxal-phosphate dependent enzyme [Leptospira santarosai]EMM77355.1 pyridoxal-phosphate dependent protein [Leptospira santarosai str. 2000030832]EMP82321.1 pyridoxal-phosphate dependent protein [Leptospira santarosai str. CBC1531]MDI7191036.1 pyridoxal-phosphate dependent enzyme [Leptospira santarosai]MDI7215533.1 pyridoxal-phosphate dependent enzyme [Leptospira santarosai]